MRCRVTSGLRAATLVVHTALATLVPGELAAQVDAGTMSFEEYQRLHPFVSDTDMERLGQTIGEATVEVQVTYDSGPMFHPRYIEGTGAAVWIDTEQTGPILVTTWTWLAGASSVRVRQGDAFVEATPVHGSAFFDLAMLDVAAPQVAPLPIVADGRGDGTVFTALPALPAGPTPAMAGALGSHARRALGYYRVTSFPHRNGYPITNVVGELVGILSIHDPDGTATALAIDASAIVEWITAWPRILDASPTGVLPLTDTQPLIRAPGDPAVPEPTRP